MPMTYSVSPYLTLQGKVNRSRAIFARVVFALALLGFLAPATPSAEAATPQPARQQVTRKPTVKKTTVHYSARASRARRAKLARARAARVMAEAALPHFKTDANGDVVPVLHAAAAIIYNPETNQVLWESNSQDKRSIASITKVMTATVFVEADPDMNTKVTVDRADVRYASTTYLRANDVLSVGEVLHLLLIASDNAAARVLARVSPWGSGGFVARMNEKAAELGLTNTSYADPSGLDADNVSSAYDMARLISYASSDQRIASIMRLPEYTVQTDRRTIAIHSTNQLVRKGDIDVLAGKTGFISKAGYCLATLLQLPEANQQVAVVVLGARSNSGRFNETRNLFQWLSSKAQQILLKKPDIQ
jgi:serine-type D-Ala-D-Ala endopeptidase (penicillin-binding protein 7)